jgi:hypothetical protein
MKHAGAFATRDCVGWGWEAVDDSPWRPTSRDVGHLREVGGRATQHTIAYVKDCTER